MAACKPSVLDLWIPKSQTKNASQMSIYGVLRYVSLCIHFVLSGTYLTLPAHFQEIESRPFHYWFICLEEQCGYVVVLHSDDFTRKAKLDTSFTRDLENDIYHASRQASISLGMLAALQ